MLSHLYKNTVNNKYNIDIYFMVKLSLFKKKRKLKDLVRQCFIIFILLSFTTYKVIVS